MLNEPPFNVEAVDMGCFVWSLFAHLFLLVLRRQDTVYFASK